MKWIKEYSTVERKMKEKNQQSIFSLFIYISKPFTYNKVAFLVSFPVMGNQWICVQSEDDKMCH